MSLKNGHIAAEELSAYLDGDIETGRSEEVEAHLAGCDSCSQVVDQLSLMTGGLQTLAADEPRRDLWRGIQRDLGAQQTSWWKRFWMVPASAVAGAAAAVLIVLMLGRPATEPATEPKGPMQALQAVADAEIQYRTAIDSLDKALGEKHGRWSQQTRDVVEHGLAEIDETIERCRTALRTDPSNMEAQETMLAAYQHKVDFMTDLVAESM